MAVVSYYADAHLNTTPGIPLDANNAWSFDAAPFQHVVPMVANSNLASSDASLGSNATRFLHAKGTTAPPTATGAISQVRVRFGSSRTGANTTTGGQVYTAGLAESLGTFTGPGSTGAVAYGTFYTLSKPAAGWTWPTLSALEVKVWDAVGDGSLSASFALIEYEVTYAPHGVSLSDTFTGTTIDTTKWSVTDVNVTESNQLDIALNPYESVTRGVTSVNSYDLTGAALSVQLVSSGYQLLPSVAAHVSLSCSGGSESIQWIVSSNKIFTSYFKTSNGQPVNSVKQTYDPNVHKWLRIANLSGTTVTFDWSTDGATWTTFNSYDTSVLPPVSGVQAVLLGEIDMETGGTVISFDNFNLGSPTTATGNMLMMFM